MYWFSRLDKKEGIERIYPKNCDDKWFQYVATTESQK